MKSGTPSKKIFGERPKPLDRSRKMWYNEYRNKGMGTLGKASQAVV